MFEKSLPNDCIRTADLWCGRRPLYQLSHNHCPALHLLFNKNSFFETNELFIIARVQALKNDNNYQPAATIVLHFVVLVFYGHEKEGQSCVSNFHWRI